METKTIAVHDGNFHADELFALTILLDLPQFQAAKIIRTRNTDIIKGVTIAIDVGNEYNHEKGRYDHHQRGFCEVFDIRSRVKMAAAGLIWRHYGREYLRNRYPECERTELLHSLIYDRFVKPIDGNDNGVDPYMPIGEGASVEVLYSECVTIHSKVGAFNIQWDEEGYNDNVKVQKRFDQAYEYIKGEFTEYLDTFVAHRLPVYEEASRLIEENERKYRETGISRKIVVLERYMPMKDAIPEVENMYGVPMERGICFIVQPRDSGDWAVNTIPIQRGSKAFRVGLKEEWRGVRDFGAPGLTIRFVHATGFLGVAALREDAIKMAEMSLAAARAGGK